MELQFNIFFYVLSSTFLYFWDSIFSARQVCKSSMHTEAYSQAFQEWPSILLRTLHLHSVPVGAKPLSTGQCAPRRRLYQMGDRLPPLILTCFPLPIEAGVTFPSDVYGTDYKYSVNCTAPCACTMAEDLPQIKQNTSAVQIWVFTFSS